MATPTGFLMQGIYSFVFNEGPSALFWAERGIFRILVEFMAFGGPY